MLELFIAKVKIDDSSGCWVCTASRHSFGYGWIRDADTGKTEVFHRAAWKLFRGPIPPGMHVLHKVSCHNPPCGNPEHLYLGTNKENSTDKILNGTSTRGEKDAQAKLTEKEVHEIKELGRSGVSQSQIAKVYKVSQSLISMIVSGHRWAHVT